MIIEMLKEVILANIGPLKPAPKGWLKSCCKLCHTQGHGRDTRHRFGIQFNSNSIVVHCFNCGFSAGYTEGKSLSNQFKFFLGQLHIDQNLIKRIEFEIFKKNNSIEEVRDGDSEHRIDKEKKLKLLFQKWVQVELPAESLPITKWLEYGLDDPEFLNVVNYALGRKLFDLDNFYWSPSTEFNINQRLIIPYYYKHKIVGFTSRLYYNVPDKSIPKYYQQCPTDFVYNLDNQQDWVRKYTIVTEGILDAVTVDGVSILGEIGQEKIDIINRLQKEIIVCPDRDKKGWDLVKVAIDNDWAVSFPKWDMEIKDAAQAAEKYGRLLTTHSIISSTVSGKDKIQVKWTIDQNARERKRK